MNTFEFSIEIRFVIALALGFLIGLERESTKIEKKKFVLGGVRTFPIISLLGFSCAWLYKVGVIYILPVGLLSIAILSGLFYYTKTKEGRFGFTSEVTALLTFTVGALTMLADVWIALSMGIINALLLSEKAQLESYVERLNKVEYLATLRFLIVTIIIFPVLPNQDYTQFRLNPQNIWKIVVMVSSIGFVGYFLIKKFGSKVGMRLSGIMGGIVSSTAVTISAGRTAKQYPGKALFSLQSSILASSVMYLRILIIIWVINFSFIQELWWRLIALSVIGMMLTTGLRNKENTEDHSDFSGIHNPFELKPALIFAVLFVLLSVLTNYLRTYVGNFGLLVLSFIIGMTDIDPYVISIVNNSTGLSPILYQSIIFAMMSNTLMKGTYFYSLSATTRKETSIRFISWALLHIPIMLV